jgi:hypothetical protein
MAALFRIFRTVEVLPVAQEPRRQLLCAPVHIGIVEVTDLGGVYRTFKTLLTATAVRIAEIARRQNLRPRRITDLLGKCSCNGISCQVHTL